MIRHISFLVFLIFLYGGFVANVEEKQTICSLAENGVGAIKGFEPRHSVISQLFPSLKVVAGIDSSEGIEFPIIKALNDQTELLISFQARIIKTFPIYGAVPDI